MPGKVVHTFVRGFSTDGSLMRTGIAVLHGIYVYISSPQYTSSDSRVLRFLSAARRGQVEIKSRCPNKINFYDHGLLHKRTGVGQQSPR